MNWSRSLDYIVKEFGIPWYMFHRVDLHNELKMLAFDQGKGVPGVLKLGSRVVSVVRCAVDGSQGTRSLTDSSQDPDHTKFTLQDGTEVEADVIFGADGVHVRTKPGTFLPSSPLLMLFVQSKTVIAVTGEETPATPTGQAAYRFIIPVDDLLSDPETAWLVENRPVTMNIFPIEDRRIACYPCRR